jgi:hypothetical protein
MSRLRAAEDMETTREYTMTIDLSAIRDRVDAATEGPWALSAIEDESGALAWRVAQPSEDLVVGDYDSDGGVNFRDDAEFIANARQDVPALLAEIERLTAERDQYLSMLVEIGDSISPTGERPEEAFGTLVRDVQALAERKDVPDGASDVEWGMRVHRYDRAPFDNARDDKDHALASIASVNDHVASLNEATRRYAGDERAELIRRTVTTYPDGGRYSGAWATCDPGGDEDDQ